MNEFPAKLYFKVTAIALNYLIKTIILLFTSATNCKIENQGLRRNACTDHGHTYINFHNFSSRRGLQIQLNNYMSPLKSFHFILYPNAHADLEKDGTVPYPRVNTPCKGKDAIPLFTKRVTLEEKVVT